MDASRSLVLAPPTVFGGDVAERITNGDMETAFTGSGTAYVASAWILDITTTGMIDVTDPYAGISAQSLTFIPTTNGSAAFGQQINGLDTNNDYGVSAYLKIESLSAFQLYDFVLRAGPSSGGSDFQGSSTASGVATAGYELLETTWTNTATPVWVWVTAIHKNYNIVLNSDFEGTYTNGLAENWYADSTIQVEANDTDVYGAGSSAQEVYYPAVADGSQVYGQLLTGLVPNQDYTLSSIIKHVSATSLSDNDVVVSIGPDTADTTNVQVSATARNAAYAPVELTWQNTADTVWLMIKSSATADTTDQVTNGDMEGNYSSGVAPDWIISDNIDGNGLTATVDETNVRVGTSAQRLTFSSTAAGTEAFAQQLATISAGHDYVASAYVKILEPSTAADTHQLVFRVGPNSGGADFISSVTASNAATADWEVLELTWPNTATDVWLWFAGVSGSEVAVVDGVSANLSAVNSMILVDDTSGSLTATTIASVTADNFSMRSASASEMDSITATNAVGIQTPWWTMTCPNGIATPSSGQPFQVQVSNANSLDPALKGHYVNPVNQALKSSASFYNQSEAIDSAFESSWVNWGDLSSSAFVGSGNFRWMRVVNLGSFTGTASAFKAYLWTSQLSEMF